MSKKIQVVVLRVFVNSAGQLGNPVGIIVDEKREMGPQVRQRIATDLGFSESVFVNDTHVGLIDTDGNRMNILQLPSQIYTG